MACRTGKCGKPAVPAPVVAESEEREKISVGKIKRNDLMAFIHWVKVDSILSENDVKVQDVYTGQTFYVKGKVLLESALSADQYARTENVSMTQAAEKLVGAKNTPFTVCFEKQDGTKRVLRGKLIAPEPLLGRSKVEDLDEPRESHRMRQVDHRTILWLVLDNVQYVVK